jgi:hypothetical protein
MSQLALQPVQVVMVASVDLPLDGRGPIEGFDASVGAAEAAVSRAMHPWM